MGRGLIKFPIFQYKQSSLSTIWDIFSYRMLPTFFSWIWYCSNPMPFRSFPKHILTKCVTTSPLYGGTCFELKKRLQTSINYFIFKKKFKLKNIILSTFFFYTGCPKKNETGFLLNISATKYRISKPFFSRQKLRTIH